MLGLLSLFLFQIETIKSVAIEEIVAPIMVSAVTYSKKTYFSTMEKGSPVPHFVFYVWHHADNSFQRVDDGRIPSRARFLMEVKGEIISFNYQDPLLAVWDTNLKFKRTDNLWRILGVPDLKERKIIYICSYGPGKKLITLRSPTVVELGISSDSEPFQVIHRSNVTENSTPKSWTYSQNTIFLFEKETGKIQTVDEKFRPIRTLQQGFQPVSSRFNSLAKRYGGLEKNEAMVAIPWTHANVLQAWYTWYYDLEGNRQEPNRTFIVLRPEMAKKGFDQRLLVGFSASKDLLFDPDENMLTLESHAPDRF